MSNIIYVTGNALTDPAKGSFVAHACNTKGVWGSGIALEARHLYPGYYQTYRLLCRDRQFADDLISTAQIMISPSQKINIVNLFTSKNYGVHVDRPKTIIANTRDALTDMFTQNPLIKTVCMPKINSGAFKVPWEATESVLREFDDKEFIVYTREIKTTKWPKDTF